MQHYYLVEYYDNRYKKNHSEEYYYLEDAAKSIENIKSMDDVQSISLLEVKEIVIK